MNDEIKSLGDNKTWTFVSKPVEENVINNLWAYKIKSIYIYIRQITQIQLLVN